MPFPANAKSENLLAQAADGSPQSASLAPALAAAWRSPLRAWPHPGRQKAHRAAAKRAA